MYPICIASTGLGFYFLEVRSYGKGAKARFPQVQSECDWLLMSSVFVASQSSCFFLCSRNQIRLVENKLKRKGGGGGGRH